MLADQARKYVISECGVNLDGDSMISEWNVHCKPHSQQPS